MIYLINFNELRIFFSDVLSPMVYDINNIQLT